jgi:hypothetical protein
MKSFCTFGLTGILLFLTTNNASAFNFGFVRAPDWMDQYFGYLLLLSFVFWILTILTKPTDVPFNQLYRTKVALAPTIFHRAMAASYLLFMVLVFVGMGLARYSELGN